MISFGLIINKLFTNHHKCGYSSMVIIAAKIKMSNNVPIHTNVIWLRKCVKIHCCHSGNITYEYMTTVSVWLSYANITEIVIQCHTSVFVKYHIRRLTVRTLWSNYTTVKYLWQLNAWNTIFPSNFRQNKHTTITHNFSSWAVTTVNPHRSGQQVYTAMISITLWPENKEHSRPSS